MSESRPPRVLFVHQSADLYGSDRMLLPIVAAVQEAGGEAILALPCDGPLVAALRLRGAEVHVLTDAAVLKLSRAALSARGLLRLAGAVPAALRALDRIVAGRAVDAVHSNTLAVLAGALWSRRHGVRHVWHLHEMIERPAPVARALTTLVRALADVAACNSRATHDWLVGLQPALAPRATVVRNGVEDLFALPFPPPTALAAAFRPAGARLAIGLVGRLNRMKGHALLLEAAERLHAAGRDDFSLVFIGDAPPGQAQLEAALRARVAASPLRERVVMAGFVAEMSTAYAALDIVAVPSTEAEAFGLVAVEAMAARRPVIAARIGGLPEIVEHGRTGWLHAPGDAADLARGLGALLDDETLCRTFGEAGRHRFEAEFTLRAPVERFLALYAARPPAATRLRSA